MTDHVLDEYRTSQHEVVVLVRTGGVWTVECYDRSDISRWAKDFKTEDEARTEFNRWRT